MVEYVRRKQIKEESTCRMRMSGHDVSVSVYVSAGEVGDGTEQRRKKKGKKVEERFLFLGRGKCILMFLFHDEM